MLKQRKKKPPTEFKKIKFIPLKKVCKIQLNLWNLNNLKVQGFCVSKMIRSLQLCRRMSQHVYQSSLYKRDYSNCINRKTSCSWVWIFGNKVRASCNYPRRVRHLSDVLRYYWFIKCYLFGVVIVFCNFYQSFLLWMYAGSQYGALL